MTLEEIEAKLKERGFESIDAILADRDQIAEDRDKVKEQNENAQKLIQRQGAELGELRKTKPVEKKPEEHPEEETVEKLEKELTDSQKEAADKLYQSLPDESDSELSKKAIAENPEIRKKFLKAAKFEVVGVPKSLFAQKSVAPDAVDEMIKELFKKTKEQVKFTPTGPSSSRSGGPKKAAPAGGMGVLQTIKMAS